ncbi:MAG TPA: hypothetical protein PK006_12230 [Saprospiraceae bacterium]|nr:hypothetical protein [Saprospiraceae bacterium]
MNPKTRKKRAVKSTTPKSYRNVKFGIDFGAMIDNCIKTNSKKVEDIAADLGVQRQALYDRVKRPYYGTTYQLLEAAFYFKVDLITPLLMVYQGGEDTVFQNVDLRQYQQMEKDLEAKTKECISKSREIDMLYSRIAELESKSEK